MFALLGRMHTILVVLCFCFVPFSPFIELTYWKIVNIVQEGEGGGGRSIFHELFMALYYF